MKAAALIIAGMLSSGILLGQDEVVRVRAGHTFKEEFPPNLRYRYANFQGGQIIYSNGRLTVAHDLNYDILYGGVTAIQANGDTIILADREDFKYFKIKDAIYYRAKRDRYLEVLAGNEDVKLGMYERFIIKRRDKISNDNYQTYVDQTNSVYSLRNSGYGRMVYYQDLLMKKDFMFYIVDKDGTIYKAKRSRFLTVFSDQKRRISNYLKENPVDFHSRHDLTRLFEYCAQ